MTRLGSLYPYDIVNRSGETIPSLSIVKLDTQGNATVNKRLMTGVTKPDGGGGLYLVTGPMAVEDDRYGKAALPVFPVWVRYSGTAPQQGDAVGPTEDAWTVSTDGTGLTVWQVDPTRQLVLASGSSDSCRYYWEFHLLGGKPTTGSQVWSVTIDEDTQDVTIDYDMTAADLKTELLSEFSGLSIDDVETDGGPLPEVALSVEWRSVKPDWPPVVGANTLNNEAWMAVEDTPGSRG